MKLTLDKKRQETPTIYSFIFKPEAPWQFKAGQLLSLTVPHENPDNRGIVRPFSISSSPTENFIMITTRIIEGASSFKRALLALPLESQAEADGPFGSFILPENQNPCLFITGGVGITPVRSMLKYATDRKLNIPLTLLYSNVTPEEIVYYEFFNNLKTKNPNLDIVYTITKPEETKQLWSGQVGRIDKALVREKIKDSTNTTFYVSGPISLVENFTNLLKEINIPEEHIKRENFPGY